MGMKEAYHRRKVHEHLSKHVYQQGMDGTATGGTWDTYYENENTLQMAWIEWKRTTARKPRKLDLLTDLQDAWGTRAEKNGRRCAVVVCGPNGVYIFKSKADYDIQRYWGPITRAQAAHWIEHVLLSKEGV